MLPRLSTAYEIKETSIMRDTSEDKIIVSGKTNKPVRRDVMIGSVPYLYSLFCYLQVN